MFDSRLPFPDSLDVNPSDGGDSGASTPPLWPTSPADTPCGRGHVLSPASRTQAILQGRRELMDMIRNMPESCYELSLKDLVELPRPPPHLNPKEEKRPSLDEYCRRRGQGYGNTTTMVMGRSGSMGKGQQQQEGLLLKMVFPVPTGVGGARGRRKQRKEKAEEDCSEECWRKQGPDSESGDSLSSSTMGGSSGKSSGSGSSCGSRRSNNARRHERHVEEGVCCSFLRRKPPKCPLHGIPYGLKDIISVPGYKTTWGSGTYKDQVLNMEAWVDKRQ